MRAEHTELSSATIPHRGITSLRTRAECLFHELFANEPAICIAAPGRVNIIGSHTDYNHGYTLAAAIGRHVVIAASPRADRCIRIYSDHFSEQAEFSLDRLEPAGADHWVNYARGVAWALQQNGCVFSGMDAVIVNDLPIRAGLGSSAAIEIAMAYAFQLLGDLALDEEKRALLCQKAENEFVGMRCGILDQYTVSFGKRNYALLIDFQSLTHRRISIPIGYELVICDTRKHRPLVDSHYNTRRRECETGASLLGAASLRDISIQEFCTRQYELDPVVRKRCRHVVTENQRVLDSVEALQLGDLARFAELMRASHTSLHEDYEVSCGELEALVGAAWSQKGVFGARLTGAGFGGCTVNLVASEAVEAFLFHVAHEYVQATGIEPQILVCPIEDGIRRI